MARVTARVELHGASERDYQNLHTAMQHEGYARWVRADDNSTYHLPPGSTFTITWPLSTTPGHVQRGLRRRPAAPPVSSLQAGMAVGRGIILHAPDRIEAIGAGFLIESDGESRLGAQDTP